MEAAKEFISCHNQADCNSFSTDDLNFMEAKYIFSDTKQRSDDMIQHVKDKYNCTDMLLAHKMQKIPY